MAEETWGDELEQGGIIRGPQGAFNNPDWQPGDEKRVSTGLLRDPVAGGQMGRQQRLWADRITRDPSLEKDLPENWEYKDGRIIDHSNRGSHILGGIALGTLGVSGGHLLASQGAFGGGAGAASHSAAATPGYGGAVEASPGIMGAPAAATPALAGQGGNVGIIGSIINYAKKGKEVYDGVSDVFGGMSDSREADRRFQDTSELDRYKLEQAAPQRNMNDATRAASILNRTPVKAEWGGPGSGLAGQTVHFGGGIDHEAMANNPEMKALMNNIIHEAMVKQLSGNQGMPAPTSGHESTMDKVIGGIATGSSILGALNPRRGRTVRPGQTTRPTTGYPDEQTDE